MFTGIIEAVGRIKAIKASSNGARIDIDTASLDMNDVKLGDSIATNGVCLTVISFDKSHFSADVSSETLARTGLGSYGVGQAVNLEKAMLPTTRFGGHMVSGHVDAVVEILAIKNRGNSIDYWLQMPAELAPYIAEKGSITIDGVSLTVNALSDDKFRLTIVPHTTAQTIISQYKTGMRVNIEVDLIARYIERLLLKQTANQSESKASSGITEALLMRSGFIKN
ncbi:riboflavin synthase [Colwelliaceae bacterium 6471]